MTNIIHDATTPQLQVIDGLFKAYRTRDMNNAGNFLSKDFTFRSFPKIASLPDQTKEEHLQMFGPMCEGLVKVDHVFHEVVEAPGKVVLQWTGLCTPPGGATFEYDTLTIFTLAEEDGELKVLEMKDFVNPEQRSNFHRKLSPGEQTA